jgi:hypothetical protein
MAHESNERKAFPLSADTTSKSAASKPAEPPRPTFHFIDRPDCTETFADAITGLSFDGQTLRLEFAVSRLDEGKSNTPLTGRRYPICRLVLPPAAAVDLMQKMQQVTAALVQAGYLKPNPPRPEQDAGPEKKPS